MTMALIVAILCVGAALALAARAAALPRIRAEESLGQIEAYGYRQPGTADERTALLPRLAARLGNRMRGDAAETREADMRKLLLSAGIWGMTPASFIGYRVLASFGAAVLFAWVVGSGGASAGLILFCAVYAALVGWFGPIFYLKARARRRIERIEIEMPELIDLLVVTLEAGLGFNAALMRSVERMRGPLGNEIRLVLREHNLGLATEQALSNMLERCDAPAVRAFVRSVTQGESLGVSIAQVMRELAGDLRTRRRQIIEEKAQKAPLKILFPLAFLILPTIFIVVLFPGLYNMVQTLGS